MRPARLNQQSRNDAIVAGFTMNVLLPAYTFLRAALAQKSLNIRGLPLIPKRLWRSAPHYRTGFNEFVHWIHSLGLERANWIVDAGANHGDFAQAASAVLPEANVLLIEPLPALHQELERRVAERPQRWQLARCALGSVRGTAELHIDSRRDDIASLVGFGADYRRVNASAVGSKVLMCEVRTLEDLCVERGITAIDLLKVDVEGFEFEVIEGAGELLARTGAIVIELSLIRRADSEDAIERMLHILRLAGFRLIAMHPSYYDPTNPWIPVEFNILARRAP